MLRAVATVVLAMAMPVTTASLVEQLTGVSYQSDGGSGHDASDFCDAPFPTLPKRGTVDGSLVPVDDPVDAWALFAKNPSQAERVRITLAATVPYPSVLEVFAPGACEGNALAICAITEETATACAVEVDIVGLAPYIVQVTGNASPSGPTSSALPAHSHCSPACYSMTVD